MTHRNGCFDRAPLKAHRARDGYWCDGQALTIKAVTIPQTMSKDCRYTHSELGQKDAGCDGCKWKTESANA